MEEVLDGVLHCYDRIILTGSIQSWSYAQGMTGYLYGHDIRIFDYVQFAQPLHEQICANAEALAQANGLENEYIRKKNFRKEDRIRSILQQRGEQPGLVHIFSALEPCLSYKPWHNKQTGKMYLKLDSGKCLHYYIYFIHEQLGLCFLRVPTWCPFRLQFYFNGHAWLAAQLKQKGVAFELLDNAFAHIADYAIANELVSQLNVEQLHIWLDAFVQQYCPVVPSLNLNDHWSIWQAEYATDLVFRNPANLQAFYPLLLETLISAVKPADIATFLGRKLHGNYQGEKGNRFHKRWLATPEVGVEKLHRLAETHVENDHRFKGFNLLSEEDAALFRTLLCGEFTISGFTAKNLRHLLTKTQAR